MLLRLAVLAVISLLAVQSSWAASDGNKGGEKKEGPPNFVLMDSDPLGSKMVGPVINIHDTISVRVLLEVLDDLGEPQMVGPLATQDGFEILAVRPYFLNSSCDGDVYLGGGGSSRGPFRFPAFLRSWVPEPRPGLSSANQPDQERSTAYRDSSGPDSLSDANCAITVGDWEEPSGESRLISQKSQPRQKIGVY